MHFTSRAQKALVLFLDLLSFFVFSAVLLELSSPGVRTSELFSSFGYWFVVAVYAVSSYVLGSYEPSDFERKTDVFRRLVLVTIVTLSVVVFVHYLGGKERSGLFSRPFLVGVLFLQLVSTYLVRLFWRKRYGSMLSSQRWLFLVSADLVESLRKDLLRPRFHIDCVFESSLDSDVLKGQFQKNWNGIVVGHQRAVLPIGVSSALVQEKLRGLRVLDLALFYEKTFLKLPIFFLGMDWFYLAEGFRLVSQGFFVRLKRLSDLLFGFGILLLSSPVLLLAMICIPLESRGPIFFRQLRTGKDGRNFWLIKLRSMSADAEKAGPQWAQTNDARVTRLGNFLRKTRIDELPQLWNVLKGQMSLIGPRPERPEFNAWLEKEIPYYQLRHVVRPGLTGWAQVHYPYGASVEDAKEKLQYELWYIKNSSLFVDFQILLKTIGVVFLGKGR